MSELPVCKSGGDMARLDGQRVRAVGIYRRELVAKKQGDEPSLFLGHVEIELDGRATDYDQTKWEGAPATIRLGTEPRPDDEVAAFTDKAVEVEGRLVVSPPVADPDVAQEDPSPTLFDVGDVRAAR